jgi:CHAD domain-containing protein
MDNKVQPSFHPHEPIAAGLPRINGELVEVALAPIARPSGEPDEDIHAIRTSIKRLRALLLLVRPVVAKKTYERENARLRDAARRLAFSRDSAVARKTLLALAKTVTGKRDRDALAQMLKGFHKTVEPPDHTDHTKALRDVAAALREVRKGIPWLRLHAQEWEAIRPGLEVVYRTGRQRMKRAFAKNDDESFHRWRIRVKNLLYQLQMLAPVWPARLCKILACLEKLQRKLGDDHDLVVVKSVLESSPGAFGGPCAIQRVVTCLDRRSQKLRKVSRKLGKAIFDEKPRRFVHDLEKQWRKWRETKGSMTRRDASSRPTNQPFERNGAAPGGRGGSSLRDRAKARGRHPARRARRARGRPLR